MNPNIQIQKTPFFVPTQLMGWKATIVKLEGKDVSLPRRAGISSFGAGGANAHVLVEEYLGDDKLESGSAKLVGGFILSAKTKESLQEYRDLYVSYLKEEIEFYKREQKFQTTGFSMQNLLYTLQTSREAMEVRLTIEVREGFSGLEHLYEILKSIQSNSTENIKPDIAQYVRYGTVSLNPMKGAITEEGPVSRIYDTENSVNDSASSLLNKWLNGEEVEWVQHYGHEASVKSIALPQYPFKKQKYWLPLHKLQEKTPLNKTLFFAPVPSKLKASKQHSHDGSHFIINAGACSEYFSDRKDIDPINFSRISGENRESEYFIRFSHKVLDVIKDHFQNASFTGGCLQVVITEKQLYLRGIEGLLKVAREENSLLNPQLILVPENIETQILEALLLENKSLAGDIYRDFTAPGCLNSKNAGELAYIGESFEWKQTSFSSSASKFSEELSPEPKPWKNGGTYIITGGMGGLGKIFAHEISKHLNEGCILLVGRSPLSENHKQALDNLNSGNSKLTFHYYPVDITDTTAMDDFLNTEILGENRNVKGIIHSAGIIKDNYILKKSSSEFESVVTAKVKGLFNLGRWSPSLNLDFLCCFSSVSSIMGNPGQGDYACANAYMNYFMQGSNLGLGDVNGANGVKGG
ncbi:MAG: SDR family NAD(P)-dependent oxidoreductase, partial [Candidatus Margulisbacteria bacterium]|nr:SDR family NAD(P)-dependent oxidoreductase [Candidatus Margulisiibacteriota bacterium]